MFGFEHQLTMALGGLAALVSWLFLYDIKTRAWRSPKEPNIAIGYGVVVCCMLGILLIMNTAPARLVG
jgi:hypothetical protein